MVRKSAGSEGEKLEGGSVADPLERMRRELARGTIELAILSVLAPGQRYGYELLSVLKDLTGGVPEIKEGTLYPLLHRLEDAGQITSEWVTHERNAPRKYYSLTPAGEAQLHALREAWSDLVKGMRRVLDATQGARR